MDVEASFGDVLKTLRNRKSLSRPTLALRVSVHPRTLENWERGDVLPDRARVQDLIDALELSEAERLLLLEAYAGYRILPKLHNLPASQNPYFTGREEILAQLHHRLAPGSQVALTQAISGLGGIGKTQVALEYAYRYQKHYSHLLWVTADSRETLIIEFCRLARDLDLTEKDERDQSKIVRAMQRWLREYLDWLLIFDNVEDLSLIPSFVPSGHLGSVLLTTRRHITEPVAQALQLDALSDEEGMLFLLKRSKHLTVNGSGNEVALREAMLARAVTQQLGGLPLALDQAGAYIAETACDLSGYLDLFKQQKTALLQRRGTVPTDHPQSVTTTFALAFEQLEKKNKTALELLKLCALLAPDAIPLELITQGAAHLGRAPKEIASKPLWLDQILEVLQAYSLVRYDSAKRMISIHRLVQAVMYTYLKQKTQKKWIETAVKVVNDNFPSGDTETWFSCERFISHALTCASLIQQHKVYISEAIRLLNCAGRYLNKRAQYSEAEFLLQLASEICKKILEPEHPDTATSLGNLALLYRNQAKYKEAEALHLRALAIREKVLGPEHPDTATSLSDLAAVYDSQGRLEEIEPLIRQALAIREKVLGLEHIDTATSLHNLGDLYYNQGKYSEAEVLLQQSLVICEKVLGPEGPFVAHCLNTLASLYETQGKYEQAEPLYERALTICEKVLGPKHPDTANTLHNVATLHHCLGKFQEAKLLYERALAICEKVLGKNHPYTRTVQKNYVNLLENKTVLSVWETPNSLRRMHQFPTSNLP